MKTSVIVFSMRLEITYCVASLLIHVVEQQKKDWPEKIKF